MDVVPEAVVQDDGSLPGPGSAVLLRPDRSSRPCPESLPGLLAAFITTAAPQPVRPGCRSAWYSPRHEPGTPRACSRPSRLPAGWLGKFRCGATVLVALCPQQVRIGHWRVAMSVGAIAGDRIRPLAGPAPTPRVSPRPPYGFAVSSSISVPARPSCHRQASPGGDEGFGAGGTGRAGGQGCQPPQLTPLMATARRALPAPGSTTARHPMRAGLGRGPTAEGGPGISQRSR